MLGVLLHTSDVRAVETSEWKLHETCEKSWLDRLSFIEIVSETGRIDSVRLQE